MSETIDASSWLLFPTKLRDVITMSGMVKSKGEADRMIKQNAVELRYERDEDPVKIEPVMPLPRNYPFFLRVGRQWKKISIEGPRILAEVHDLPDAPDSNSYTN